jgi:hypothetical protein
MSDKPPLRRCNNIKSRAYPDVQCKSIATQGDFCARHYKRPVRFNAFRKPPQNFVVTPHHENAVKKIQRSFKSALFRKAFLRQGPTVNCLHISENKTDLYSLEPIESIPRLYVWSYKDANNHFWIFDIRSFTHMMSSGLKNPYTQLPLTEAALTSLEQRLNWLKQKGYVTMFLTDSEISADKAFSLGVLDVFMKFDFLGYHSNSEWFLDLDLERQKNLYRELFDLWNYRLTLTKALKEQIAPGLSEQMKYNPLRMRSKQNIKWWRNLNLEILDALVSRASEKSNRSLGAMYSLKALCAVSPGAAEAYDWLA